jgi:hypothetical protein
MLKDLPYLVAPFWLRNARWRPATDPIEDIAWLSLDAYSGVGPSTVTATADPTGLPAGTYTGTITVTGDTGDSPQFVQVTLRISEP